MEIEIAFGAGLLLGLSFGFALACWASRRTQSK
jgi:hypothetical protein